MSGKIKGNLLKIILRNEKGQFVKGNKIRLGKPHTKETKILLREASKKHTGENASNWQGGCLTEIICQQCGNHKMVKRAIIKEGGGKFCSRKCKGINKSKIFIGEKHPNWKGGQKEAYKRRRNNHKYILNEKISGGIRQSLKRGIKNGRHWENLLCYTFKQLEKRLKSTMPIGYTWQDFHNGDLHIDHIIPISAFEFEKPEDFGFQQCWRLDNLQLLTKEENSRKNNKLIKPFQLDLVV